MRNGYVCSTVAGNGKLNPGDDFCNAHNRHFLDDEFSWKDVLATFIGCVLVFLAVGVGVLFNVLSN